MERRHRRSIKPQAMVVPGRGRSRLALCARLEVVGRGCVACVTDPIAQAPSVFLRRTFPGSALLVGNADRERLARLTSAGSAAGTAARPPGTTRERRLDFLELSFRSGVAGALRPSSRRRGPEHERPVRVLSDPVSGVVLTVPPSRDRRRPSGVRHIPVDERVTASSGTAPAACRSTKVVAHDARNGDEVDRGVARGQGTAGERAPRRPPALVRGCEAHGAAARHRRRGRTDAGAALVVAAPHH